MTDFPDLKIKAVVNFPASVNGGTGLNVVRSGAVYTFNLDHSELTPVVTVPSLANTYVVLWDAAQNTYSRISLSNLKIALGIV